MNAEKYVNDIVARITCSKAKRSEIRNQLLSDISARMDQGETLEQIICSMGTAREIAEAFCQNLPEAEQKAYKKKKTLIIVGAAALGLLLVGIYVWWAFPKPVPVEDIDGLTQESIAAEVKEVVELLNQDDFETLQSIAVEEMKEALTPENIDPVRDKMSEDWGQMQSMGTVYASGIRQKDRMLIITQTDAIYENISVVYTITFDKNMKLAGMYMR